MDHIIKNVVFSTTRQWNPGDEFILLGIINLLREVIGEFNPVIFNRNPEVRPTASYLNPMKTTKWASASFSGKNKLQAFLRIGAYDNSFKDAMDSSFFDYAVFAGTPEWKGRRSSALYDAISKHGIPTLYLGVGSSRKEDFSAIKERYRGVLEKARLITVRDAVAAETLRPLNPYFMPCPSFFASPEEREIRSIKKIGLIFESPESVPFNRVDMGVFNYLISLYKEIFAVYECEIVCHYIDELPHAHSLFEGVRIHYSYDSKDYLDIYKNFDLVIGPRLHGIGLGASLGIPGMLVAIDLRAEAARSFGSDIIETGRDIARVLARITEIEGSIGGVNSKLKELKTEARSEYISLLKKAV